MDSSSEVIALGRQLVSSGRQSRSSIHPSAHPPDLSARPPVRPHAQPPARMSISLLAHRPPERLSARGER